MMTSSSTRVLGRGEHRAPGMVHHAPARFAAATCGVERRGPWRRGRAPSPGTPMAAAISGPRPRPDGAPQVEAHRVPGRRVVSDAAGSSASSTGTRAMTMPVSW